MGTFALGMLGSLAQFHSQYVYKEQPRLECRNRQKGWGCPQKSATLLIYEIQVLAYMSTFTSLGITRSAS